MARVGNLCMARGSNVPWHHTP